MKAKLQQLASQLDDVMHQAEFMANWVQDNRRNRQGFFAGGEPKQGNNH